MIELTKQQILDIRCEAELHIRKAEHLKRVLRDQGFNVQQKDTSLIITRVTKEKYGNENKQEYFNSIDVNGFSGVRRTL